MYRRLAQLSKAFENELFNQFDQINFRCWFFPTSEHFYFDSRLHIPSWSRFCGHEQLFWTTFSNNFMHNFKVVRVWTTFHQKLSKKVVQVWTTSSKSCPKKLFEFEQLIQEVVRKSCPKSWTYKCFRDQDVVRLQLSKGGISSSVTKTTFRIDRIQIFPASGHISVICLCPTGRKFRTRK